jgi:hypothetical protein
MKKQEKDKKLRDIDRMEDEELSLSSALKQRRNKK